MKKLCLTALAGLVFTFATTSSAEVVRTFKVQKKNQALTQIVPVAFSAPASSVAGPANKKANKHKASASSAFIAPAIATPAITTVTAAPKKHRGPGNAAVTGVSPLFLPVANVTPTLASVSTSGGTVGHKFKKNVVSTPSTPSLAAAAVAAVPEPAYTSLALLGLFGAGLVIARRRQAGKANPVAL